VTNHDVSPAQHTLVADCLLVIHFVWALWMITGVALAVAGYRWPRLWRWRTFRITHLLGLLGTASVPIWANGICPLTSWEWNLRNLSAPGGHAPTEPFLIHWIRSILFIDVPPIVLSIVVAFCAIATLTIFILHPPGRRKQRVPVAEEVRGRSK